MKVRKIAIAACFASALMMVSAPASAAAYFIAGKWYFFSLDFNAELAKVTGKDLNDGTRVDANVTITASDVQCANPQGNLVDPGQGPRVVAYGTSDDLTDGDILRADRKRGNIYAKSASVALPTDPPVGSNPCKDPAGVAEWRPTYWRYKGCDRGTQATPLPTCYADRAVKINGTLIYTVGGAVVDDPLNWTFVYLPTVFTYVATVRTGADDPADPTLTGECRFPANNEAGARFPGQPYSLSNPPSNGWGAAQVDYVCTGLPALN